MLDYIQRKKKIVNKNLPKTFPKPKVLPPPSPNDNPLDGMDKWDLDKEFVKRRIRQTEVRTMAFEMDLARIRESLIEKELVIKQLSFLLVAMRQKILAIPSTYARKLLHKEDMREVNAILQQLAFELAKELQHLPQKAVDANWLEKLEEEGELSPPMKS
jgi:hypothetical protein